MRRCNHIARERRRRGFTLVELVIVMALLALIGTVTVGFVTLVSGQTHRVNARADFADAAFAYRTALEDEFAKNDKNADFPVDAVRSLADHSAFASVETDIYDENPAILKVTLYGTEEGCVYHFLLASRCGGRFVPGGQGE